MFDLIRPAFGWIDQSRNDLTLKVEYYRILTVYKEGLSMSSNAEREDLRARAAQVNDAILAKQDVSDVIGLVRELVLLRGENKDLNGACAVACLTLIFGPEVVPMSMHDEL